MCGKNKWQKKQEREKAVRGMIMNVRKKLIDKDERIRTIEKGLDEGESKKKQAEVKNSGNVCKWNNTKNFGKNGYMGIEKKLENKKIGGKVSEMGF